MTGRQEYDRNMTGRQDDRQDDRQRTLGKYMINGVLRFLHPLNRFAIFPNITPPPSNVRQLITRSAILIIFKTL
jgi:hypothetical protein